MAKTTQIRIYDVKQGHLDDLAEGWRTSIVPLREAEGYVVENAWVLREESKFVWVVSYDGPEDFAKKEADYYASRQRTSIDPDPAQFVEHITALTVDESVFPGPR
jgi:hypothetical protein